MFIFKNIYLEDKNSISNRRVKLQRNDFTYYLYLTKFDSNSIDKDALAFMIKNPPKKIKWEKIKKNKKAPYLSKDYVTSYTVIKKIKTTDFKFIWSIDGNSVALLYKNEPIAFIIEEEKIGFSKATKVSSPIVNTWNEEKYQQKFNLTTAST